MLFKKLLFKNYKTFYGPQEINLTPPPAKEDEYVPNIALIGGLNGAGKTTILKAIWYALFGTQNMSQDAIAKLKANIINNYAFAEGSREAHLSLFLESGHEEWEIAIKFHINANKIVAHEERVIFIRALDSQYRQKNVFDDLNAFCKYTNSIIPSYAAPFFIFDGEEIKSLIQKQDTNQMIDAINTITGANAYNTLLEDLQAVINTLTKEVKKTTNVQDVKQAEENVTALERELEATKKSLHEKQLLATTAEKQLRDLKIQRQSILSKNSESREKLSKEIGRLESSIQMIEKDIEEIFKKQHLNILLANKINALKTTIRSEKKIRENTLMRERALKPFNEFLNSALKEDIDPPLTPEQLKQIQEKGTAWYAKQFNISLEALPEQPILHDISNSDEQVLLNLTGADIHQLATKIKQLNSLKEQLSQTEKKQLDAPEAVNVESENTRIQLLNDKKNELAKQISPLRLKVNNLSEELTRVRKKFTTLAAQSTNSMDLLQELEDAQRTYSAISQHVRELTLYKTMLVKDEFESMLRKLMRKNDEFSKIEFDLATASIRLYNNKNQEIDLESRSAGEQQMISSALIWALTRISYLNLPIVIDTPLGRLDSQHRRNLIENYYKDLSSQVIILSTDTEVSTSYLDEISQYTYSHHTLDYDDKKQYTVIRDGYFGTKGL